MIDPRAAVTAAILIALTGFISVASGAYVALARPEALSPAWILFGHVLAPCLGIAMWMFMRRQARQFPDPANLEHSFRRHFGTMLVFACALAACEQAYFAARDLGVIAPSSGKGRLFIAALGVFFVAFGNVHGKLPSPFKGHAEPFSWDKMSRFTGWMFVIYGFALVLGAFTVPDQVMLPALIVLWSTGMALLLVKRRQLKQDKKNEAP